MVSKKYIAIIPLVLVEVVLQLLFFWAAPNVDAKWAVYTVVSLMSVIHLILVFLLGVRFGARRAAAPILAGTLVQVALLVTAVGLLALNASLRSTIFLQVIVSMVYAIVVLLLVITMEEDNAIDNMARENMFPMPPTPVCVDDMPEPEPVAPVCAPSPSMNQYASSLERNAYEFQNKQVKTASHPSATPLTKSAVPAGTPFTTGAVPAPRVRSIGHM